MHRTRARTPSFITFLRFSRLLLSPPIPPRSFFLALSASLPPTSSDLANTRPSCPSAPRPSEPSLCELSRVQSLTFHRAGLIAAALTYCATCCMLVVVRSPALLTAATGRDLERRRRFSYV